MRLHHAGRNKSKGSGRGQRTVQAKRAQAHNDAMNTDSTRVLLYRQDLPLTHSIDDVLGTLRLQHPHDARSPRRSLSLFLSFGWKHVPHYWVFPNARAPAILAFSSHVSSRSFPADVYYARFQPCRSNPAYTHPRRRITLGWICAYPCLCPNLVLILRVERKSKMSPGIVAG
jgi:hypothetical protein